MNPAVKHKKVVPVPSTSGEKPDKPQQEVQETKPPVSTVPQNDRLVEKDTDYESKLSDSETQPVTREQLEVNRNTFF